MDRIRFSMKMSYERRINENVNVSMTRTMCNKQPSQMEFDQCEKLKFPLFLFALLLRAVEVKLSLIKSIRLSNFILELP